jgi:hypothetical protein
LREAGTVIVETNGGIVAKERDEGKQHISRTDTPTDASVCFSIKSDENK